GRQSFFRLAATFVGNIEGYEGFTGQRIDPAGAAQEFKIIKLFVRRYFAASWNGNLLGQQQAASVARVADAFGNPGTPSEPSGIKGVLKQQGDVKLLLSQLLC